MKKKRETDQTMQRKHFARRLPLPNSNNSNNTSSSSSNGNGSRGDAASVTVDCGAAIQVAILAVEGVFTGARFAGIWTLFLCPLLCLLLHCGHFQQQGVSRVFGRLLREIC